MNISDNERFHVLAHKALAKQATSAEQRELRLLITDNPKLKDEMEELGGEAAIIRELLPLLEDLGQPPRGLPNPLMNRLKREVREVLDANRKSKGELRELLGRLEDWAHQQADASREEVTALVALLRGSLLEKEREGEATLADVAMRRSPEVGFAAPRLREELAGRAKEEAARRQEEMERRLVSLEERFGKAAQITRECQEEVRELLEAFARGRESGDERRGQNPNPMAKAKD